MTSKRRDWWALSFGRGRLGIWDVCTGYKAKSFMLFPTKSAAENVAQDWDEDSRPTAVRVRIHAHGD